MWWTEANKARYSKRELLEIVISWLVVSFCFSLQGSLQGLGFYMIFLAASLITVGLGFVLHELVHRHVAKRFGCYAEFRMWPWGLILALVVALASGGRVIFAAPGAVYITPLVITPYISSRGIERVYGLISLSGPLVNIALAAIFHAVLNFKLDQLTYLVAKMGFNVNLWLAAFNLIPIPPLDGFKVFRWNLVVWAMVTIPTWAVMLLMAA
ncbi:MAG: site-2 protease family protein [Candidatus Nezhaarchaeota archaeon]|nr:site-2 protease family protein [Candidatus Nezhaarchaeota archaeon]MCX8141334.1 site-2 protease family protein [Candidatus Nezhaarchaeota archaeon]MDW8049600.1 site-2 protease family protein [Nitrososphaerota archaeon]